MPETLREVAALVWIEHLEPREVAPILGLEPEAVRQRLSRARKLVDEALQRDGGAP
jgi:DNA-directed RNA polymerase specialized sigma24 family protein